MENGLRKVRTMEVTVSSDFQGMKTDLNTYRTVYHGKEKIYDVS